MVQVEFRVSPERARGEIIAKIEFDDALVGNIENGDRSTLNVPAGTHLLKLEAPGYISHEEAIDLIHGIQTYIVVLQEEGE